MLKSWTWAWVAPALAALAAAATLGAGTRRANDDAAGTLPDSLPIYELEQPDTAALSQALRALGGLGVTGRWIDHGDRLVLDGDSLHAEVFKVSNGIWFENPARLWNPAEHPVLPGYDSVRILARRLMRGFLPGTADPQVYDTTDGRTLTVSFDVGAQRRTSPRELDRKVTIRAGVQVAGVGMVPVTGGGGELTVAIGDRGRLLQLSGVVRPVRRLYGWARTLTPAEASRRFLAGDRGARHAHCSVSLAYYSAPMTVRQQFSYPVWVCNGTTGDGREAAQVRATTIPASDFVPPPSDLAPELDPVERGPVRPAAGSTIDPDHDPGGRPRLEAGTAWITKDLDSVVTNKKGFVDALAGSAWKINFDTGDAAAHEESWAFLDDDARGVDAADFVFYNGHAAADLWYLWKPINERFVARMVGPMPGNDRWGAQDLEWLVIAACGPLQDKATGAADVDVFRNWQGAFDGLHLFMGFASRSQDNAQEGKLLARAVLRGEPIAHTWLRVAQEVQPVILDGAPVWVGVVFAVKAGVSTQGDHLWGHGTVAPDPRPPAELIAIWTTT